MPKRTKKVVKNVRSKSVTKVSLNTLLIPLSFALVVLFSAVIMYRTFFSPALIPGSTCVDSCPGKLADYQVVVYDGVENKFQCVLLGGTPYTIQGWEREKICIAR